MVLIAIRLLRSQLLIAGLIVVATLLLAVPAGAQPAVLCNGVPATIVATTPGRIDGTPGADVIVGTAGADEIVGLGGNDVICAGAGDDTLIWNPGDGSDVMEGQEGADSLVFSGADAAEIIDISANGARVRFIRDIGNITMDLNGIETLTFNALGGADAITVNELSGTDATRVDLNLGAAGGDGDTQADSVTINGTNAADTIAVNGINNSISVTGLSAVVNLSAAEALTDSLTINGLDGDDVIDASKPGAIVVKVFLSIITLSESSSAIVIDDPRNAAKPLNAAIAAESAVKLTLNGGLGVDTLIGSAGDDLINGGAGNDVAQLGAGNDTFIWNPGDGSDIVEGQDGIDTLVFNGSNAAETITISANSGRTIFTRDIASITMDLNDLETVTFNALGGVDQVAVNNLTGADVTEVNVNLAGAGGSGDGQADTVSVNGANGNDTVVVTGSNGSAAVTGLAARVNISNAEAAFDALVIALQGGEDVLDASGLAATVFALTVNGGLGVDTLIGSAGNDIMNGGDGNDLALLGAGNDTFIWNPGDDSDTVEGQAGNDTMIFNGANVAETITISANGERTIFTRDIASVTMDLNDLETVTFNALGGADRVTVNDLTGADVTEVNLNLAGGGGSGDGQSDRVTVNGTNNDDVVFVTGSNGSATVIGLAANINISTAEPALDALVIALLNGEDVLDASGLAATVLTLTGDGGDDDDVLIGSAGADTLLGGNGDDVLIGGPGVDILDGGAGDNVIIQD